MSMVSFYLLRSEKPWRVQSGTENVEDMSSVTGFESRELALGPGMEEQMWPERSREGWGRNEPRGWERGPQGVPQWGDTADIPGSGTHRCKSSGEEKNRFILCVLPSKQL